MSYNKLFKQYFLSVLILLQLCGCLVGGAGSIKAYNFPVSKPTLQKAVEKVIAENSDIHRDTVKNYMIDVTNGKHDTIWDNHYNDGNRYITFKLENYGTSAGSNEYIFQYSGYEEDWDTAKTSCISISYAYDANNNGGADGYGGFPWYKPFLKKRITNLFEIKFIDRVDKVLGKTHTIDN